jgi:hypothetical protein
MAQVLSDSRCWNTAPSSPARLRACCWPIWAPMCSRSSCLARAILSGFKGELYSPHFQTYNRNKRSITLNTKDKADLARFDELVPRPMSTSRTFAPAWPRTSVPVTSASKNQPAPDLLRHQRLWPDGPYSRPAQLRLGGPGGQRLFGPVGQPGNPRVVGPALADA